MVELKVSSVFFTSVTMSAKPIFTVGLPEKDTEQDQLQNFLTNLKEQFTDYYILMYTYSGEEPKFQVFYEKDFNKVKFKELKQIVKDQCAK